MDVFEAIADPIRREILEELMLRGSASAGEIAAWFSISRPAVSRHLRVLRETGLVRTESKGRLVLYRLEPAGLATMEKWLDQLMSPATRHLDALETEILRTRSERRRKMDDYMVLGEEIA